MPGDLKKKPEETRLRFVVLFLFLGCVSIVLTSHILYHQHIGEVREVVFKQGERGGGIYSTFYTYTLPSTYGRGKGGGIKAEGGGV